MKQISILGSTGSIGSQALEIIRNNRERFSVNALSCGRNLALMCKQIEEFVPELVVTERKSDADKLRDIYSNTDLDKTVFLYGEKGLIEAAKYKSDLLLNALSGMRGLVPTFEAIKCGKNIALANKETLVAGGNVIMEAAKKAAVQIIPVDSEHSAIFQCLQGELNKEIKKLLITASGGPFRGYSEDELRDVSVSQALNHPKWSMGKKITIDSATLMNKGLEVIEARWLFDVGIDMIEVLVHPQSIVHSAVEFIDTAIIAQLGFPDMKIPISVAFSYPKRLSTNERSFDFFRDGANLTFEKPDIETFKCLKLAIQSAKAGGLYSAAMNGANEVLVEAFLEREIGFTQIADLNEEILNSKDFSGESNLESILAADKLARDTAFDLIRKKGLNI